MNKKRWLRDYKKHIEYYKIWGAIKEFTPPKCNKCGHTAIVIQEPDGACGDPECCPQTSHITFICINEYCDNLSEQY